MNSIVWRSAGDPDTIILMWTDCQIDLWQYLILDLMAPSSMSSWRIPEAAEDKYDDAKTSKFYRDSTARTSCKLSQYPR